MPYPDPITAPANTEQPPSSLPRWSESFASAPDGARLDRGRWRQLSDDRPAYYDRLGTNAGGIVVNAYTRGQPYAPPDTSPPFPPGQVLHGIGGAYRDLGSVGASVSVTWAGNHATDHAEAAPLVHVDTDTASVGWGVWWSEVLGVPVLFAGTIGGPPEQPAILATNSTLPHTSGTPRVIRVDTTGTTARVYIDGTEVTAGWSAAYPLSIPTELRGSTRHGFAVDMHLCSFSSAQTVPAITAVTLQATDPTDLRPGAGRLVVERDAGGNTSAGLYLTDAAPSPAVTLGQVLGIPGVGIGGDAFLARSLAGVLDAGINGAGTVRMTKLRLVPLASNPAGPNVVGEVAVVSGKVVVCTVAGSPGTWTVVGTQT